MTAYARAVWRKSSHCSLNENACLEVADGFTNVPVRDSKTPGGPVISIGVDAFAAFVGAVREGAI